MQGADHESAQLLLLELADRDRTRATGVVAPPAPPYLLLSHGEEIEERVRLASEAAARFDLYVQAETSKKPTAVDTPPAFKVRESRSRA